MKKLLLAMVLVTLALFAGAVPNSESCTDGERNVRWDFHVVR